MVCPFCPIRCAFASAALYVGGNPGVGLPAAASTLLALASAYRTDTAIAAARAAIQYRIEIPLAGLLLIVLYVKTMVANRISFKFLRDSSI